MVSKTSFLTGAAASLGSVGSRRSHLRNFWLRCLALLLAFAHDTGAQTGASKEYEVKAAFLFNFIQFVEWPADTFNGDDEPFTIGVFGDDPFGGTLEETVRGETFHKHKIVVRHSRRIADMQTCQLVFVSKSEKNHEAEVIAKCASHKTLTVSDLPDFANHGGIIDFYAEGKKIRFEINPGAAKREGLKVSSQLLNLGKIVEPDAPKGSHG